MPKAFEQCREDIAKLVKHFAANREAYRAPGYKEAQARSEFIDPLFVALGWDVHNEAGAAPQYREVIPEPSLDIGGQAKAPDYVFRVGRDDKFFAEAKKPGVNLKDDPGAAYQVRNYGWNADLPLSVLTDFEEFAIYNCRVRPYAKHRADIGRLDYFTFEQYPDVWRKVWELFSREAVWGGSFDRFIASPQSRRGASQVGDEFLKDIEKWREGLAHNIANRNAVEVGDLNDAVQRTIDRIIFLRMAEDRGMEESERLLKLAERENLYAGLVKCFNLAEAKYNSGLFDFQADPLTLKLKVDDAALKPVIKSLYDSYNFRVMPAEILGSVYEQFLGKVIRLTDGGQARVKEKLEVQKAKGVHYTPSYIVGYIVRNTVGKQVEGRSPKQLRGYRVLDMACGSGSFLLGAYQCLLDHYLKWYVENGPGKNEEAVRQTGAAGAAADWRLTIAEKKDILTEHIYGVDIDRQAVEVTKLSLLLKVLEGETDETVGKQMQMFHERALPNLDNNIKCGNSLIGPDYFSGKLLPDKGEMGRINPFGWHKEFPEVFPSPLPSPAGRGIKGEGGFDAVIGNPPYVRIQNMKEWAPAEVEIYKELYRSAGAGNYDIYVVFVEQGLSLLGRNGKLGFILPHKFFNAQYGEALRKLLAEGRHLAEVVHFGDQQVFAGATTYTCLMFLEKSGADRCGFKKVADLAAWRTSGKAEQGNIPAKKITSAEWTFSVGQRAKLLEKLNGVPQRLQDVAARIFQGIIPGADKVYALELRGIKRGVALCFSRAIDKPVEIEASILRCILSGAQVKRYRTAETSTRVIYPYLTDAAGECRLISPKEMQDDFPLALAYFRETKSLLDSRDRGSAKGAEWYRYVRTQNIGLQPFPKLAVPRLVSRLCCAHDQQGRYCLDNVDVGGVILSDKTGLSALFVMALLNSKLLDFVFRSQSVPFRGNYFSANRQYIEQLPIRPIDFLKPADKAAHDRMVALVEKMLELHKRLAAAKGESGKPAIERLIAATDSEIDRLVYELYGLTKEEVAIVEGER